MNIQIGNKIEYVTVSFYDLVAFYQQAIVQDIIGDQVKVRREMDGPYGSFWIDRSRVTKIID